MNNESMHPGGLRLTDRAARLAGLSHGMRAADVGCGNGATLRYLKSKYDITATGFDVSEECLASAKASAPGVEFILGDAARFQRENDSVDIVFCECALSDMDGPEYILKQIHNLLRPGGKLVFSDIYAKKPSIAPWTKDALITLITAAGFEIIIEEDHTPALVTFAAEYYNSGCAGLGYILVIAGKSV